MAIFELNSLVLSIFKGDFFDNRGGNIMNQLPLDILMKRVDNKYTLAVLAAKRAREIVNGSDPLVECKSLKPVSIALAEISQGKITFQRTKYGIK